MTKDEYIKKWLNDGAGSWVATVLNIMIECYGVDCDYIDAILEEEKAFDLKLHAALAD